MQFLTPGNDGLVKCNACLKNYFHYQCVEGLEKCPLCKEQQCFEAIGKEEVDELNQKEIKCECGEKIKLGWLEEHIEEKKCGQTKCILCQHFYVDKT
jgi:hypothetical protein